MSKIHNISANALFHFTKTIDNLYGILKNEFIPRYRKEDFTFSKVTEPYILFVPMVCFCDLPLSQVKDHISSYGDYGIGLTKQWGVTNGLNPVIYLHKGTLISNSITDIGNILLENAEKIAEDPEAVDSIISTTNLLRAFIKPYELEDVRYYDEREWRFVPKKARLPHQQKYINQLNKELQNDSESRLRFEPTDIKYIIIQNENERLDMIRKIREIKGKYSDDERDILISKIFVTDDIRTDV
jgi:hypothetical protein